MKLNDLKIKNFRTIKELEFSPAQLNVITGKNGSGKSSILEALSFLLTGKAGPNPVREGAECAEVECEVMGTLLQRKCSARGSVKLNGKTTTQKSVQQWFEDATGVTADTLRVATSSGMLAAMNSRELSEYLIANDLIPAEIDIDTIAHLCTISPDAMTELSMLLPVAPTKFEMDAIQEAYSYCYNTRPSIKRELADLRAKANYTGPVPLRTLDEIDQQLAAFASHATEMTAYERLLRTYNDTMARREQALSQLEVIKKQLAAHPSEPVNPTELTELRKKEKEIRDAIMACVTEMRTIEANLTMFTKTMDNLGKPVCPISEKLICTTDKTAIREELSALIGGNKELHRRALARQAELNNQLSTQQATIAAFEKKLDAYRSFESLKARYHSIEASIPPAPAKPIAPEAIPNLAIRIQALKDERAQIFAADAAKKAAEQIPTLEARVAVYDELVSLLSPKGGIREKIIEATFEPLIEHCNERANILKPDFRIGLVSNDGIHITCKPVDAVEAMPIDAVSSGEQLLAMLLILDAINALSGLGILVLDDLDKLDETSLDALFELLTNPDVAAPYDHIFVAMVDHEDALKVTAKYASQINLISR